MNTVKKGYKAVSHLDGKLVSYDIPRPLGMVEYRVDEWTYPRPGCGPLAISRTMSELLWCYNADPETTSIYSCEYIPSIGEYMMWTPTERLSVYDSIQGTILASAVKLIRPVKRARQPKRKS